VRGRYIPPGVTVPGLTPPPQGRTDGGKRGLAYLTLPPLTEYELKSEPPAKDGRSFKYIPAAAATPASCRRRTAPKDLRVDVSY